MATVDTLNYTQIPPDSTGKKMLTNEVTTGGNDVHIQCVNVVSPFDPKKAQEVDEQGAALVSYAEGQPNFDSFNNMKVAQNTCIGYYEHTNDSYDDLFCTCLEVNATKEHHLELASIELLTSEDSGSSVIRSTNRYHYCIPGVGSLCLLSISCGDAGTTNNTRRWGYFDGYNGCFFELANNVLNVVIRNTINDVTTETRVSQANWNIDSLDGRGDGYNPTNITLDVTKSYIYWISLGWAGPGAIRFGIFSGESKRITAHRFNGEGFAFYSFLRQASLPIRFENFNTDITSTPSSLHIISSAVFANSRDLDYTFWRFSDMECVETSIATSDTPILSVRAKQTLENGQKNTVNTYPEKLSVFTNGPIKIDLYWDLELDGYATWALAGESAIEGDNTATSITIVADSWKWHTFYVDKGLANLDLTPIFELRDEGILLRADGAASILSFIVTQLDATENVKVTANLSYRELY